jgi:hypothetical protein
MDVPTKKPAEAGFVFGVFIPSTLPSSTREEVRARRDGKG